MVSNESASSGTQVIAIPVAQGRLCLHFGHCEQFALIEVDAEKKAIVGSRQLDPPVHEPGVLPRWLHEQGVSLVIAGGMGMRAQNIFAEHGINVIVGVPPEMPEDIVNNYLQGNLVSGENACDH